MIKIVSVYPKDIANRYGGGHWKAIQAFHHLVYQLDRDVIELGIDNNHELILDGINKFLKKDHYYFVFHYSFWPNLIKQLKQQNPDVNIAVRTINAEGFQHWQRSDISFSPSYTNLRNIYGSCRLVLQDQQCRFYADNLLGISQWDNKHYWKLLPGKAEISYFPYHCPWPELRPHAVPLSWEKRHNTIVCLPGGRDPIGKSQVQNFIRFAHNINQDNLSKKWRFQLSPGVYRNHTNTEDISPVSLMPELDEPWDLLCSVKALALLTPLGFGTKTTIIDALTAGCHVIVDKTLAKRLPENVRILCHQVDVSKVSECKEVMKKIVNEPFKHELNKQLMSQSINVLKEILRD